MPQLSDGCLKRPICGTECPRIVPKVVGQPVEPITLLDDVRLRLRCRVAVADLLACQAAIDGTGTAEALVSLVR
jgi:hypothetical protein